MDRKEDLDVCTAPGTGTMYNADVSAEGETPTEKEATMPSGLMIRRARAFLFFSIILLHPLTVLSQQPMNHRRWDFHMETTQFQSPAVGPDGTIYIGTGRYDTTIQADGVYAVNPDGTQKWKLTLGKTVHSSVALDQESNLYFIVGDANNPDSMDAALYSLDSLGNFRWELDSIGWMAPIPNTAFTPAIAGDGTIYVNGRNSLYAVRPNGTVKWKYDFPLIDNVFGSGRRLVAGSHRSAPTVAKDGTIYLNTMRGGHEGGPQVEGGVYAFDPDGNLKWRTYDIGGTAAPVIDNDGTIYSAIGGYGATTDTGNAPRLLAIYPDGTRKWAMETQLWCEASPSIGADGTLYIGTTHHPLDVPAWFYAITPGGQIKWKYDTYNDVKDFPPAQIYPPDIYNSPAIDANGCLYFGNEIGLFYAMNPNGTVAWLDTISSVKYNSPAIVDDGTLYIAMDSRLDQDVNGLLAMNTGSQGLAKSPWPKFRQNNANTGRAPASGSTGVVEHAAQPCRFELSSNYPNPFNATTKIRYQISEFRYLNLTVYDVLGREVATLVNEVKAPGMYTVQFDASNASSGVYFYRIQAGDITQTKRMIFLK